MDLRQRKKYLQNLSRCNEKVVQRKNLEELEKNQIDAYVVIRVHSRLHRRILGVKELHVSQRLNL